MQNHGSRVVVIGTGGTIAGTAASPHDAVGYRAAQLGADRLVSAIPALAGVPVEVTQLAQIDSKDMDHALWRALAGCVEAQLARPEVGGVVVTHGTDTLEETAYFLQRVLAPRKPVVLAAAMRPATALLSDGPQNLLDAVTLAQAAGAHGVMAVLAGTVHAAFDVRKVHSRRLDAFDSGDAGPLAHIQDGQVRQHRAWPEGEAFGPARLPADAACWPWVEIVTSHAGANGAVVRALCAAGVHGIVIAGTGNGTVHRALEAALLKACAAGVRVLRSTRCVYGGVIDAAPVAVVAAATAAAIPPTSMSAGVLTPVQARVELLLQLMPEAGARG